MGGAGILNTVKDKKPECVRAVKFCRGLLGTFSSDDEHVNVNVRDTLLSNFAKLSKKKKKMKIRQLGPNYKRNYPLSTPR